MNHLILLSLLTAVLLPIESSSIVRNNNSVGISDRLTFTLSQSQRKHSEDEFESLLEAGFQLMERESLGGWLKLGLSERELLEQLGEPSQKGEDIFWGAIGTYVQEWEYRDRGITLQMESEKPEHPKQILSLTISAPCSLETNAGIGIGSSLEEVMQAYHHYQDNSYGGDDSFIAGTVYGGLIFSFANEKVSQIFIGAAAE